MAKEPLSTVEALVAWSNSLEEALPEETQEQVLCLAIYNAQYAAQVIRKADSSLFEGAYAKVAKAAFNHHKKYGKPPGRPHLVDYFTDNDGVIKDSMDRILLALDLSLIHI